MPEMKALIAGGYGSSTGRPCSTQAAPFRKTITFAASGQIVAFQSLHRRDQCLVDRGRHAMLRPQPDDRTVDEVDLRLTTT